MNFGQSTSQISIGYASRNHAYIARDLAPTILFSRHKKAPRSGAIFD